MVLSLNKQRVRGQDCGDRHSKQTMRALRAAADCSHHWRALLFPLSRTAGVSRSLRRVFADQPLSLARKRPKNQC